MHLKNQSEVANRIGKESLRLISQKLKNVQGKKIEDLVDFLVDFYESKYTDSNFFK